MNRSIHPVFYPQFDQAFEVKVEAHCAPAGVGTDAFALAELMVANDAGGEDLLVSIGVGDLEGVKTLRFSDNSVVGGEDLPENLETEMVLPEVVGMRMVWDPEAKVMSCYFDMDGDSSVESWELFSRYTLDGSSVAGASTADWGMVDGDKFRIGISAVAENVAITPGEVYFDNFSFASESLATGYDLWASAIPDVGQRGTETDASGNGIPNLLQYMYGLEPLSMEIDVTLSIGMNGGAPELVHGFNSTATDYFIDYMQNPNLSDPWTPNYFPSLIEDFEDNGKTFRRVTLPAASGKAFFRLQVLPIP